MKQKMFLILLIVILIKS